MADTLVESHPCAKNAQGWGTRIPLETGALELKTVRLYFACTWVISPSSVWEKPHFLRQCQL